MATIRAIEGRSVHQIQSGQVIVDLCSVVKELVENSLDAGATAIDVRFKNHGLEAIEVQDNGAGIAPEDYETIALKHYTSKLKTYDDLSTLSTFGFRGEALSSLCALSDFYITTARVVDGPRGAKLEFESSGKLKSTSMTASPKGTTVVVERIFKNLPVRRRELEKNIKREYGKVIGILQAYACISSGVKLSASNQMPKGKKTVVFSTRANPTTKENIINVYGAKAALGLLALDLKLEMQPSGLPLHLSSLPKSDGDNASRQVRIVGHVSRPVVGEGRQAADRQMFFVNSRPCALPQVAKAFNEVYKSYNITQSPFVFADFKIDTNSYDVNVSPDKRTIMLHDQAALLESLKSGLIDLFESHNQTIPQSQLTNRKLPSFQPVSTLVRLSSTPQRFSEDSRGKYDPDDGDAAGQDQAENAAQEESLFVSDGEEPSNSARISASNTNAQPEPRTSSGTQRRDLDLEEQPTLEILEDEGLSCDQQSQSESDDKVSKPTTGYDTQDPENRADGIRWKTRDGISVPEVSSDSISDEESIPRMTAKQKRQTQSSIMNAFDRMRPRQRPAETATITIGDTTRSMIIGSQESKRRRLNSSSYSKAGRRPGSAQFSSSLDMFRLQGIRSTKGHHNASDDGSDTQDADMPVSDPGRGDESAMEQLAIPEGRHEAAENEDDASDDESSGSTSPASVVQNESSSDERIDEEEMKKREEAHVAQMVAEAEELAARPPADNEKRATKVLKARKRKEETLNLVLILDTCADDISRNLSTWHDTLEVDEREAQDDRALQAEVDHDDSPEERLSLTVLKSDFAAMKVVGQFNLGFILAIRPRRPDAGHPTGKTTPLQSDELFIIDQHASDEKYNFERLQAETVVQNQRMVHPQTLELTAVEEEIVLSHSDALAKNGFVIECDTSGASPVGRRCRLVSLPMSREVVFGLPDLEELIALLAERSGAEVPRPSKVRRMFAMRACRSSIMIGKNLTAKQMERVVKHMGEIDKPWNCPHGRPTMRHLYRLGGWTRWREGDGVAGVDEEHVRHTDWIGYMRSQRA
ncbi:hypothetical protein BDY21DRAFT_348354 [Lineolata rhizophorae]|uniref:DNA mismatch repair protein PMS1 n=1 Tax=Lineolata rhizophorae TaxID=578093 RepID=A0A6A6NXJ5_9PEZI|nr:hypothetical protein BDY21DRAFT_348354 [Lineolata rhizophorae]